jgi:hypothetical protein
MRRVLTAWSERFANPHLPRTLARRLGDAGFEVRSRDVLVLFNPVYDPNTYSLTNGHIMANFVLGRQGITVMRSRHGPGTWSSSAKRSGQRPSASSPDRLLRRRSFQLTTALRRARNRPGGAPGGRRSSHTSGAIGQRANSTSLSRRSGCETPTMVDTMRGSRSENRNAAAASGTS